MVPGISIQSMLFQSTAPHQQWGERCFGEREYLKRDGQGLVLVKSLNSLVLLWRWGVSKNFAANWWCWRWLCCLPFPKTGLQIYVPKHTCCSSSCLWLVLVPEQGGHPGDVFKALLLVVSRQVSEGEQLGRWLFSPRCSCATVMSSLQNEMFPVIVAAELGWHSSWRFCSSNRLICAVLWMGISTLFPEMFNSQSCGAHFKEL